MMFLYDFSNAVMGLLIVGASTAAVVGSYLLIRPRIRAEFSDAQVSTALSFVGVMATVTSLLLAFSAVSVWDSYSAAENSVVDESNEAAELARDLAVYGPEAAPTRQALRQYLELSVNVEWPLLAEGRSSDEVWNQLNRIFREAGRIRPREARDEVLLGEIWTRINALTKARRNRIVASQASVPGTLWAVVLVATALTFGLTFVLPVTRFHTALLACFAATMGLVFFFIVAMDHPFAGEESVSHGPLDSALTNLRRWDESSAPPLISPLLTRPGSSAPPPARRPP